jgi:hypothetical protein
MTLILLVEEFVVFINNWRPELLSRVSRIRFEVSTAVAMKSVVFWDIKPQFVFHKRHITSPLQSSAG